MARCSVTESEDGALSTDSPRSNDGDHSSGISNWGDVLKKGPWTSTEDVILVEYVKKHGEGNWNAVQKHSGLARCGKSCRLRWANHLRPNLKKGAFTPEEERLIIELHAKMGNKWARMAAHLPGRTDNEIKNYWNTRIKRRQRAGLPLYPLDLCLHALPENQQQPNSPRIYGEDKECHDILQSNSHGTTDIMFDSFDILPFTTEIPDIPASVSMSNGFGSPQSFSLGNQTVGVLEHAREPDEQMSDYGSAVDGAPAFDRTQPVNCVNKTFQTFGLWFPHDPDYTKKLLPSRVSQEGTFMSNAIFSASEHFVGALKSELPSLQYQESGLGVWDPPSESLDFLVQSPPSGPLLSHFPSPRRSGLLEDLIYEAKALGMSENQSSNWAPSSNISHGDITDNSALQTCSTEFKDCIDPSSPSGNSMTLIFNRYGPAGTIRLEEDMTLHHVKSEVVDPSWILDREIKVDCSRPDAILGSFWVEQSALLSKQQDSTTDSITGLLGDDLGTELKSASSWAFSSSSWNNMPAVFQMSDIP